ncbi:MAG: prolyl oligopeptidase family serine peptidase [Cytophagales bacterium]|nr:prolyl oligopeptidase family serine peptidase [Cytophagales bacterium]
MIARFSSLKAFFTYTFLLLFLVSFGQKIPEGNYVKVVEGFDWGSAVTKVILPLNEEQRTFDHSNVQVVAERQSECFPQNATGLKGERSILFSFISDNKGNRVDKGNHVTLVMAVGPDLSIGSPMQYFVGCGGTKWVNYNLIITDQSSGQVWDQEHDSISPIVDQFDLDGTFTYKDRQPLTYAAYKPTIAASEKSPLIIWLHGSGEGGTDTTVPLLANKAANYASEEIQSIFGGAFVLVPQCQGAWMHNERGISTWGEENDVYNESLLALIKDFVNKNPKIDENRIYVGGCSNGGYMSLKLMLLDPDYFAAAYVSALAYKSKFLTDEEIERIANNSIWFIHSADDPATVADETVIPVYDRLIRAGAKDVHLSLYEHVVDLYGFYGGKDYRYNGHLSWIYSHSNHAAKVIDGKYTSVMEWMSGRRK